MKLHLSLILWQAMTLHSRLNQRHSANYLSSQLFEYSDHHQCFDYRLFCFHSTVAANSGFVWIRFLKVGNFGDLKLNSRESYRGHKKHETKILPCGIGGLLADRGLELGVERGDCVWWFFNSFIKPSSCCINCRRESWSAPRCPKNKNVSLLHLKAWNESHRIRASSVPF